MHRVVNPLANERASSPRQVHPNVFTRLQALFPAGPSSPSSPTVDGSDASHLPPPAALKVRIITWNMHESLPKGDLQELFGEVPSYTPFNPATPGAIPYFPEDENHPYHLVVVAGQECPSLSGMPLGFGAGFKLKEKEKEREKERDRERDKDKDRDGEKPRDPEQERERELERNRQKFKDNLKELQRHRLLKPEYEESPYHGTSGWTSILEDFFCHGIQDVGRLNNRSEARLRESRPDLDRAQSTGDIVKRRSLAKASAESRKGPYEMLVKERMMGIYLAIFIHRDARHLAQGTSRSAVTAGLIGGRVGNKGGVGISLCIAGTTMLFINAHLAAHEGKLLNRMANLTKIKTELSVDAFLRPDDPRNLAEDLTDKFDYTFLCGDLNFRLDISRLHADWLISRQEYAQALAFDQLFNIMRNGQAFIGFHEGTINFPPTFKYDVLRTIKQKHKYARPNGILAVQETVPESLREGSLRKRPDSRLSRESSEDEEEEEDAEACEATSVVSSGSVYSKSSKRTTEPEDEDEDDEDEDESEESEDEHRKSPSHRLPAKALVKRLSVTAALKAKVKWHELVSPGSPRINSKWPKSTNRQSQQGYDSRPASVPVTPSLSRTSAPSFSGASGGSGSRSLGDHDALLNSPPMKRASSSKSIVTTDDDRGVYDSSSKQRVPSWCDRILFKSTVKPDPESDDDDRSSLPRNAVGSFFTNAWRSFSARSRKESIGSLRSTEFAPSPLGLEGQSPADTRSSSPSTSPPVLPPRRRPRPISIDVGAETTTSRPLMSKSKSSTALSPQFRSSARSPPLVCAHQRPTTAIPVRAKTAPETRDFGSPSTSPSFSESSESSPGLPPPLPPRDPQPRWRLLSFLSRDTMDSRASDPISEPASTHTRPRKGDVVCLSYGTLDDQGMRRLEGRSDHRPVIGSYAVYV